MADRFVTVPDSLELPAAVLVPIARLSDAGTAGRAVLDAETTADGRTALGLGGAALLDVGTEAGTVAAGNHAHAGTYAAALGANDNYVTDAEKVKLTNLSGTNTGDQTLPTWTTLTGKPAVIAQGATQADARTAIGAGDATKAEGVRRTQQGIRPVVPSKIISNFQSGHGFDLYNSTGATLTADTSIYALGTQCAAVSLNPSGNVVANLQDLALPAFDATGKDLLVTVRVEDISHMTYLNVLVSSDNTFASYYSWAVIADGSYTAQSIPKSGDWATISLSWADATVTGTPNRSALTVVRFSMKCATGYATTVRAQRVALVPSLTTSIVSIVTDDIWASNYTLMRPALDAYGWGATCYAVPARAGADVRYLTLDRLHDLEDESGWEIAGHSDLDLSTLTIDAAEADIIATKQFLVDNGFRGADHYAYGAGGWTPAVETVMRKYWRSARTISRTTRVQTLPPDNPFRLRSRSVSFDTPASEITGHLTKMAANGGGWYILTMHNLVASGAALDTDYNIADFNTILAHIASLGMSVRTVGDVLAGL